MDKVPNIDMYETKKKLYNIKATVKGYPEIKTKVKVATNLDCWGPTQEQMKEICEASFDYYNKRIIMKALWKRITQSQTKEWPHIYKALAIFEYLLLHGPEQTASEIKEQLYNLRTLHDFRAVDEKGHDKGRAIREKSKKLVEWVTDASVLEAERKKANSLKNKYVGISNAGASFGASGSSDGSNLSRWGSNTESEEFGRQSSIPISSIQTRPTPSAKRATDVDALQADEDYVREQQQILESIERNMKKKNPEVAPPTTTAPPPPVATPSAPTTVAPVPVEEDLFGGGDPFGDVAPAVAAPAPAPAPTPAPAPAPAPVANDIGDFFAPTKAPAPANNDPFGDDDLFATPIPMAKPTAQAPAPEEDLFAMPAGQSSQPSDDLFGGSSNNTTAASTNAFADPSFDALTGGMENFNIAAKPAAQPGAGPGMSLKQQAAMKQQLSPMFGDSQPQNQGDDFNPFL